MQPAPLTGTTTRGNWCITAHTSPDAARTPHGDSNLLSIGKPTLELRMQPAPLTGTATFSVNFSPCVAVMQPAPLTGTTTRPRHAKIPPLGCSPCPSRGQQRDFALIFCVMFGMQPVPLTGTATLLPAFLRYRTKMQPVPLTGTKKRETRNSSVSCLPFYISACSLTSLFHIDEEGYAGILCHSPCAAGFRCVLRGRRQLVYILSLYLSYVK